MRRIFALQGESTPEATAEATVWLGGLLVGSAMVSLLTILVGLNGDAYSNFYWILLGADLTFGLTDILAKRYIGVVMIVLQLVVAILGVSIALYISERTDPAIMTIVFYLWILLYTYSFLSLSCGVVISALAVGGFATATAVGPGFTAPLADSVFFFGTVVVTAVFVRRLLVRTNVTSYTDQLTTLPNRRYLELQIQRLTGIENADGVPLGIALIDLDDFKRINDTHGHLEGDRTLRELADIWKPVIRRGDILARWGGDEFILLTVGSEVEELESMLNRLFNLASPILSISVGYGILGPNESYLQLVDRCDRALYRAKSRPNSLQQDLAIVSAT